MTRRWTLAVAAGVLCALPAVAVGAERGGLAQLVAGAGCVAQRVPGESEGTAGCARANGLVDAADAVVAPDGKAVYVAASGSNAVSAFARDPATGRLNQANCVSANGTNGFDGTKGACADGNALLGAAAVAISADGKNLYAASYASGGVAIFSRNADTGKIRQIGCVRPIKTCVAMRGLGGAASVAVSPDDRNVYVAGAEADAVVSFARDASTGLLTPLGCISDDGTDGLCTTGNALRGAYSVVVSPDGKHVYAAAYNSNSVLTFVRDPTTGNLTQRGCLLDEAPAPGSCVRAHALSSPADLAMTSDGRTLFAAATDSNAVVVLARNPATGALKEIGCVSDVYDEEETRDGCAHVSPLESPTAVAVSRDGAAVYVAQYAGLTAFARDTTTGVLRKTGCVTYRGFYDEDVTAACSLASGVASPSSIALSPDGKNLYLTAYDSDALTAFTGGVSVSAPSTVARRRLLSVRVGCPGDHVGACTGRVVLTPPPSLRRLTRSTAYRLEAGASGVVHLRIAPRILAAARRAPVAAVVSVTESAQPVAPVKRLLVLKTRRPPPKARR